jgi:predicted ATPase/DNA-binding SARP family transcriptional activator
VQFRVLGPLELVGEDGPLELGAGRQRTLLLALLLHRNEVVSSDRLIEVLWGERPPASAPKLVQGFVSTLRRVLGDGRLVTRTPGYLLRVEAGELDAERFESLVGEARAAPPARSVELLADALALWRGAPLPELRYADLAQPELARLDALRHTALEQRFEAELALGRHREALPELERLVAEEPLRERPRAQLMLALYRSGRQADALAVYADGRRTLVEELGLEPGPALRELERQILAQDPALDLEPRRADAPGNLPVPATPFLGRTREVGDVAGLLSRPEVRLLTLTGPGGSGKTRLALQVAAGLGERYPDGIWWVPLAALRDSELVPAAIGQALGARGDLAARLAGRSLLLVLDNFEQVVDAAPELAGLLAAAPGLDLLVTSRESLRVTGEQQYPVPPLEPDEGIQLFLARAHAVEPALQAEAADAAEICRRLDALPLALELAAARVKALSLAQIRERLERRLPLLTGGARDLPQRQQTLRATIEWSHELLGPAERRLFARLSVFSGGCTLEAAEAVAGADVDTLQSLVEKNLLRHAGERYRLLETIREFAGERLAESGEAQDLERRHAEHFLALAEEAKPHVRGVNAGAWLDRLETELDNLRAALDRMDAEFVLLLAGSLSQLWYIRGHAAEGRRRLEAALAAGGPPTAARADALTTAAVMALALGDAEPGLRRAREGLDLNLRLGDDSSVAYAVFVLAHGAADTGDAAEAERLFADSRRRFGELGDTHLVLLASFNLAQVVESSGDAERARALHRETLRQARDQRDPHLVALSLVHLASFASDDGNVDDALAMLRESVAAFRERGDRVGIEQSLAAFASVLARAGSLRTAARLVGTCEELRERIGSDSIPGVAVMNRETVATVRGSLGDDALAEELARGRALTVDEAIELALGGVVSAP